MCYSGITFTRKTDAYTHIYSEIINALEFAEVFLEFGVKGLILHLCVFQESPEFLQSIQLTYTYTQTLKHQMQAHGDTSFSKQNGGLLTNFRQCTELVNFTHKTPDTAMICDTQQSYIFLPLHVFLFCQIMIV